MRTITALLATVLLAAACQHHAPNRPPNNPPLPAPTPEDRMRAACDEPMPAGEPLAVVLDARDVPVPPRGSPGYDRAHALFDQVREAHSLGDDRAALKAALELAGLARIPAMTLNIATLQHQLGFEGAALLNAAEARREAAAGAEPPIRAHVEQSVDALVRDATPRAAHVTVGLDGGPQPAARIDLVGGAPRTIPFDAVVPVDPGPVTVQVRLADGRCVRYQDRLAPGAHVELRVGPDATIRALDARR